MSLTAQDFGDGDDLDEEPMSMATSARPIGTAPKRKVGATSGVSTAPVRRNERGNAPAASRTGVRNNSGEATQSRMGVVASIVEARRRQESRPAAAASASITLVRRWLACEIFEES